MDANDLTEEIVQAAATRCKYFNGSLQMRERAINHIKSKKRIDEYPINRTARRESLLLHFENTAAAKLAVFPFYFHDEWSAEHITRRDMMDEKMPEIHDKFTDMVYFSFS